MMPFKEGEGLQRGRAPPPAPKTAKTAFPLPPPRAGSLDLRAAARGTWVEKPRLQGGLEGHEELLPLVSPLQAVLEVLDGRPGVREVCRRGPALHMLVGAHTVCGKRTRRWQGPRENSPTHMCHVLSSSFTSPYIGTPPPWGRRSEQRSEASLSRGMRSRAGGRPPAALAGTPPHLPDADTGLGSQAGAQLCPGDRKSVV